MADTMHEPAPGSSSSDKLAGLLAKLDEATDILAASLALAKPAKVGVVRDLVRRVLMQPGGCAAVESRAATLEAAGIFAGSDWAAPQTLIPSLTTGALRSPDATLVVVECLSELRMLAVAQGRYEHPLISAERARHFLTQVLALNLPLLSSPVGEAERAKQGRLAQLPRRVLQHVAEGVGYERIVDRLVDEAWRMLRQRPIVIEPVKAMITQIAACEQDPESKLSASGQAAEKLVNSLYGPTDTCREDPGLEVYEARLRALCADALKAEASGCARSMHETGIVSPYHATLVRHVMQHAPETLADALGLSTTGRDALLCYRQLVHALIEAAVHPAAPQVVLGLALSLERGVLYHPAVAPALWHQLSLSLSATSAGQLTATFGSDIPPKAQLVGAVLLMLGLPLGIGQGNNPTCQSARALSMWAFSDPAYLLQVVTWAARDDEIVMHFEGQRISSTASLDPSRVQPFGLDAVSVLVVPHLDAIYAEMGRLCLGREGDPHRWINPEFHGWWVGRGFHINVDVATGQLTELESFLRQLYGYYHPFHNGNQPLIHPQPAGIAITDSAGRFIGWHAISIQRVALDPSQVVRAYFFNPNNDSGQDWGDGVQVSTAGHGERYGEASLPFEQFASRLYIFHVDPAEPGEPASVPREALDRITAAVHRTWAADRLGPPSASDA